jgi:FKBP-type peptidyl-prolyl cis-trans isomerase
MKGKIALGLILILSSCLSEDFVDPTARLRKDIAAIDSYLAAKGINAIKDASGIRIVVTELGTAGLPPNEWNDLEVEYVGKLLATETIFGEGTVYQKLSNYITGWQIGLAMLPEGSKATLYIPSFYGYGDRPAGSIPANSNLIFDVYVKNVEATSTQTQRLNDDIESIDTYIAENEIVNTQIHESGIRYIITQEGSGNIATWFNQVKISYKARLLNEDEFFLDVTVQPSESFSSRVVNFPHGVIIALQYLKEGSKGTFYVPSGLAFGPRAYSNAPANSIIVYEIEVLEVFL